MYIYSNVCIYVLACLHALLFTVSQWAVLTTLWRSDDAAEFLYGRRTATGPVKVFPCCPFFSMLGLRSCVVLRPRKTKVPQPKYYWDNICTNTCRFTCICIYVNILQIYMYTYI